MECTFTEKLSVSSSLSSLFLEGCSLYCLMLFCISVVLVVISTCSFLYLSIRVEPCVFAERGQRYVDFVYSFKKPGPGVLGFVNCIVYVMYFLPDLSYLCPLYVLVIDRQFLLHWYSRDSQKRGGAITVDV